MNNQASAKMLVKQVKRRGDTVVLMVTLLILFIGLFLQIIDGNPVVFFFSWIVVLSILGLALFYIKLQQISFIGNALRVQNGRHQYLKIMADQISHDLDMPQVDIFISQNPYLNAFAFGYMKPYTIVLHSAVVEELTEQEVRCILVHEMGHVKLKHTWVSAYTLPIAALVPILGPVIGWIFGFWNRRAELAADRMAVAYTKDPHTVVTALTKVYVGSRFATDMGEEGIAYQQKISHGMMKLFAQSLASHPFLTTRGYEAIRFGQKLGIN